VWHGLLLLRLSPSSGRPQALLVQEYDTQGYWKILANDLSRTHKDEFAKKMNKRVQTMATDTLEVLSRLTYEQFALFVMIYREEELRLAQDAPVFTRCMELLHAAEASKEQLTNIEAAELLSRIPLNEDVFGSSPAGTPEYKSGIAMQDWTAFQRLAHKEIKKRQPVSVSLNMEQQHNQQDGHRYVTVCFKVTEAQDVPRRFGPPKGRAEQGEDRLSCAIRELCEETKSSSIDLRSNMSRSVVLSTAEWVQLAPTCPHSLFMVFINSGHPLHHVCSQLPEKWKPTTTEISLCAWMTVDDINQMERGQLIQGNKILDALHDIESRQ
jgi:ADP-ribose pyrophosphatase YjhB (NUDIX family)